MGEAFDAIVGRLGDRVVKNNGVQAEARCPAHDDNRASLGVGIGKEAGLCVIYCAAGCSPAEVLSAIGMTTADLFDDHHRNRPAIKHLGGSVRGTPSEARKGKRYAAKDKSEKGAVSTITKANTSSVAGLADRLQRDFPKVEDAGAAHLRKVRRDHADATLTIHRYNTADGQPFGAVFRADYVVDGKAEKAFSQATCTPTGTWIAKAGDVPWPLFGLDTLPPVGIVTVHEGEKSALAAEALGLIATTSKGGSSQPTKTDWSPLAGREVAIFPDNDEPGERYASVVAGILARLDPPAVVRIARVPGLPHKGDVADMPAGTDDELLEARRAVNQALEVAEPAGPMGIADPADQVVTVPAAGAANVADRTTWNDTGLGRRIVAEAAGRIRYVVDRGTWVRWTGTHWEDDATASEPQRVGKAVGARLWDDLHGAGPNASMPLVRFVMNASNRRSIDAAIALAKSEPAVEARSAAFDADADLVNVANGILDLRSRELRPHDPAAMLTKLAGVEYVPGAACPKWLAFVEAVTRGDADLAGFLQRSFGLALSADQSEQRLWIHHGEGSNGKGTALAVLNRVFGTYAGPAPVEILLARRHDGDREIGVAKLAGKRLAFAQEADDGVRLSEATVKALTGSDPLTGRFLYQNNFEIMPTWHLHLAVNDRPSIRGTDHGIWRRVTLVPWLHTFTDAEKRPRAVVESELLEEGPGILNWLLDGYRAWRADGLRPPEAVTAATSDYRVESDSVRAWIADACQVDPTAESPATELFVNYRDWCRRAGDRGVSQTKFGRTLDALGYRKDLPRSGPHRDRTVRLGLRLVARHVETDLDEEFTSPMGRRF